MTPPPRIVLASASPRRARILCDLGVPYRVVVSNVDEAEELVGGTLVLPRDELQPAEEGRHYVADLIGVPVETTAGEPVVFRKSFSSKGSLAKARRCSTAAS